MTDLTTRIEAAQADETRDWNQADDLTGVKWPLAGYAPGNYMGTCRSCRRQMHGCDKRASQCLACAVNELRYGYEQMDSAFRIKVWNEAKKGGLSDRAAMDEIAELRALTFLDGLAEYFGRKDAGGEDASHWANVQNAINSRAAATVITTLQAELAEARRSNTAPVDDHKSQSVSDNAACVSQTIDKPRYKLGDYVQKKRGSSWRGVVVGFYSTVHTPIGYCVDSAFEPGSVQVWPEVALEDWDGL